MTDSAQVETHEFVEYKKTGYCGFGLSITPGHRCGLPASASVHQTHERVESEPELKPERVWLPDSLMQLAAASSELENVEGAYWVREFVRAGSQPQAGIRRQGWEWYHEHDAALIRRDGMMCEQHPGTEFPHGDCAGPGMSWCVEGRDAIRALASSAPAQPGAQGKCVRHCQHGLAYMREGVCQHDSRPDGVYDHSTAFQCGHVCEFAPQATESEVMSDELVDEVQRRMDAVVDAAVEWKQWDWPVIDQPDPSDKLEAAVAALLELPDPPKETKQ